MTYTITIDDGEVKRLIAGLLLLRDSDRSHGLDLEVAASMALITRLTNAVRDAYERGGPV